MGGKAKTILPLIAIAAVGVATGGFGLATAVPAAGATVGGATATAAATGIGASTTAGMATVGTTATTTSVWQTAWTTLSSYKDVIGIGMSGISAFSGYQNNKSMMAAQKGTLELQQAQDSLMLAEDEARAQEQLSRTLGAQSVLYGALGVNASEGSAGAAAEAAKSSADTELSMFAAEAAISKGVYGARRSSAAKARGGAAAGALVDFGLGAYDRYNRGK